LYWSIFWFYWMAQGLFYRFVFISNFLNLNYFSFLDMLGCVIHCFWWEEDFSRTPVSYRYTNSIELVPRFGLWPSPLQEGGDGHNPTTLCRIVVGISSQIGRDGHRDMSDMSTYGKIIRNLLGSIKPPGSILCADTRRYKYFRDLDQRVKTERDLHWVERGLTFWILAVILESRS